MSKMLRTCLLLSVALAYTSIALGQPPVFSVDFQERKLESVIRQLEQDYGLLFSYEEARIENQAVSLTLTTDKLDELLTQLFAKTPLTFERAGERYILLVPRNELPTSHKALQFCGRVLDSLTQTPLAFANAYLISGRTGTVTDNDGSFAFQAMPAATDTLIISYVGYQEYRIGAADFAALGCPEITLTYLNFAENLIIVTDYLTDGIQLNDRGFSTDMTPRQMPILPGQAEPDVMQGLQFLPGIASPDGVLSNLHIRGSTPDQNLILWEDIPIYHTAHYFGSISAFNPYVIDKVAVYRGGFGADYGGRIAGVVDLKSNPLAAEKNRWGLGTNLLSAYAYAQISVVPSKHAFTASVRRSTTEAWQAPFFRQLRFRSQQSILRGNFSPNQLPAGMEVIDGFHFFDTHLKYAAQLSDKDEIAVAFLYANNDYDNTISDANRQQNHLDELQLRNTGLKATWLRTWNGNWSSELTSLRTHYDYNYQFTVDQWDPERLDGFGRRDSDIEERQLKLKAIYQDPEKGQLLTLGYQLTHYDNGFLILEREEEINLANQEGGLKAGLHTLFSSFGSNPSATTGIQLGVRANYYTETRKYYVEPRLQFWQQLLPELRFQFAAGRYYQFLNQLTEFKGANIGISSPVWVLATEKDVNVLKATHWQAGLLYQQNTWLVDLQAYAKRSKGLSALSIGFLSNPMPGFDRGDAAIAGLDLLLKKRWGQWSSWLSYSLAKVNYEFRDFFDPEFAAPFDQRHRLHLVNTFHIKKWKFSLGWQISSGLPYSFLEDFQLLPNPMGNNPVIRPIYSAFNDHRLEAQHQLDASVFFSFKAKQEGKWTGAIGLSLINIYNRTNTYKREYFVDNRPNLPLRIQYEDSVNLGFSPNFVFRMEWK